MPQSGEGQYQLNRHVHSVTSTYLSGDVNTELHRHNSSNQTRVSSRRIWSLVGKMTTPSSEAARKIWKTTQNFKILQSSALYTVVVVVVVVSGGSSGGGSSSGGSS